MKSDIGLMQEQLPNGKITTSLMRWLSVGAFILLVVYMYFSNSSYEAHFDRYSDMVTAKVIEQQTYVALTEKLSRFDNTIIFGLIVGIFAPKAIQKWIENKTALKDAV